MTANLAEIAPAFVATAHRIVWATVATVAADGRPRTRILHPIWEWDGTELTGWIATSPLSPKRHDLAHEPRVSLTYWDPSQDIATAECDSEWVEGPEAKRALWQRFADGPAPVGFDPSIVPAWTAPEAEAFGGVVLRPSYLRVFPGSIMTSGTGVVRTWQR